MPHSIFKLNRQIDSWQLEVHALASSLEVEMNGDAISCQRMLTFFISKVGWDGRRQRRWPIDHDTSSRRAYATNSPFIDKNCHPLAARSFHPLAPVLVQRACVALHSDFQVPRTAAITCLPKRWNIKLTPAYSYIQKKWEIIGVVRAFLLRLYKYHYILMSLI